MDKEVYDYMQSRLRQVDNGFSRYMYDRIDWQTRMFGLVGPRGVGKTTMFLQYIKNNESKESMLYIAADSLYFTNHSLRELADEFVKDGGEHLFIDEIHKYADWSRELKQIYDTHPDLKIAFTGSSVLDIIKGEADLSRRAPIYTMQGLSFRGFLKMFHNIDVPVYSIEEILQGKATIKKINHPLPYYKEFIQRGYYPFGQDNLFEVELNQVINQTIESDIPLYANMNVSTGRKFKQLLAVISKSTPFKPVMDKLATLIGVSRNNIADYLLYLERAGMIAQLRNATGGIRGLGKTEKIYLDNPNLAYVLGEKESNTGNIRETFFFNQMRVNNNVIVSKIADFEINGITFEVGGKNKGQKQIASADNGFIVKDDTEYAYKNILPLWSFGLNY